nr:MAG TPA: Protein of unknown function (DUF1617) [Caudoviricetes sp.]
MKLKNRDIVSFINGCAALKEKKLPIKIGYAINRNIIALTEAAEAYNMAREKIIKEYAEKDSKGELVIRDDYYVFKDKQAFNKDLEELLDIDTEVNLHTISKKDIEKCDDSRYDALTLADLDTLCIMIK